MLKCDASLLSEPLFDALARITMAIEKLPYMKKSLKENIPIAYMLTQTISKMLR